MSALGSTFRTPRAANPPENLAQSSVSPCSSLTAVPIVPAMCVLLKLTLTRIDTPCVGCSARRIAQGRDEGDARMQLEDHPLDRSEVERIAYEAIGHQFRLPALFSVVVLIVGFVLGHYVASRHMRDVTDQLESRIAALETGSGATAAKPIPRVDNISEATDPWHDASRKERELSLNKGPVTIESIDDLLDAAHAGPVSGSPFALTGISRPVASETGTTADTLSVALISAVEQLRGEAATERQACLNELAPYVQRQRTVPAMMVAAVVEKVFASQDRRLSSLTGPLPAVSDEEESALANVTPPSEVFRSDEDRAVRIFPHIESTPAAMAHSDPHSARPTVDPVSGHHRYFPKPRAATAVYFTGSRKSSQNAATDATTK